MNPPKHKRQRIYARDGHRCVACGSPDALTLDHIVPRSRGGGNQDANLQTLCHACNQAKADAVTEPIIPQRIKGFKPPRESRQKGFELWPKWDHRDELI